MRSVSYDGYVDPTKNNWGLLKSQLLGLLNAAPSSSGDVVDWSKVDDLLRQLPVATTEQRCCPGDDPMGRLLIGAVLSKNPPISTVEQTLRAFPCALDHNPAAFFTACRDAPSSGIVSLMTRHLLSSTGDRCVEECPFPWLLSEHVSTEGARAILEVYPQGVLEQSRLLSGYCLLDYMLLSPEMVEQRAFDMSLWSKFKLILLAAGYCEGKRTCGGCVSPIRTILCRAFSTPGFFTNMQQSRHILWLIHQLAWNDRWVFEQKAHDGKFPLHYVLSHKCDVTGESLVPARALVKLLLEAYPGAVTCPFDGRLPLHMAIENGWPCHDMLLALYPEALDIPDPSTELFPFQVSALQGCRGTKEPSVSPEMIDVRDLDVTYELLRANPSHAASVQGRRTHVGAQA